MLQLLSGAIQMKHKDDCLKKTGKFQKLFICHLKKQSIEILDNFLIPLMENWFILYLKNHIHWMFKFFLCSSLKEFCLNTAPLNVNDF